MSGPVDVGQTIAALAAIVRLHEGNLDPAISELLERADEAIAAVDELIEATNKVNNWLACAPIATADDMAQSFGEMQTALNSALAAVGAP